MSFVSRRYGTHRGLVRSALDQLKWRCGVYRSREQVDWQRVRRLVFVCQGNICRSPYALARARELGLHAISFGYATSSGSAANARAMHVAAQRGQDLAAHRTTAMADFTAQDGDLLLVMEDRHFAHVAPLLEAVPAQLSLLGLFARPPRALIYDPHRLGEAYFHSCYDLIDSAVATLGARCRASGAALSSPSQEL